MTFPPRLLAVLIPLALSGCATQEALTEQSQSAQTRLERLEQAVKAMDEVGEARYRALEREINGLKEAVRALEGRSERTEASLDRLALADRESAGQAAADLRGLAERVTRNESQLGELASAGRGAASQSEQDQARQAERLGQVERRLDGLSAAVNEALTLARQEQIRLNGKEAFTVLLTEDKTLYPINSPELGSQDAGKLDGLKARLAELGQDYHLEIQGHTDNLGTEDYNYELGKARADVVKRHLHERKAIPLSQMSVISYGAANPLDRASNRNRRILIRVLVLK
jgi:outer membrane protein OmpA-like peptidoglycan-associated protein